MPPRSCWPRESGPGLPVSVDREDGFRLEGIRLKGPRLEGWPLRRHARSQPARSHTRHTSVLGPEAIVASVPLEQPSRLPEATAPTHTRRRPP